MPHYRLHYFPESGNSYKLALMLTLCGQGFEPIWTDFAAGVTRTPEWRADVNEMGEVPVLDHNGKRLTQSGVILTYLSDRTGKFKPQSEDERLEALRWIIFDNQKLNGYLGPYRFLRNFAKPAGDPAAMDVETRLTQIALHLETEAQKLRGQADQYRKFFASLSVAQQLVFRDEVAGYPPF